MAQFAVLLNNLNHRIILGQLHRKDENKELQSSFRQGGAQN